MKFFYGLAVGLMVALIPILLMFSAADVQEEREQSLAHKIDKAPVGKTIQLRGKGFFVTRLNGAIGDEAFKEGR